MKHIIKKSLIGQTVEVVSADNASLQGITGTVIDESKQMLAIETRQGIKKVIKDQVTLLVQGKKIPGTALAKRIEERIKG